MHTDVHASATPSRSLQLEYLDLRRGDLPPTHVSATCTETSHRCVKMEMLKGRLFGDVRVRIKTLNE